MSQHPIVRGPEGLLIRENTTDAAIVREALTDRNYDTDWFQHCAVWGHGAAMQRKYDAILAANQTPFILNLGGHVGSTAVWFARRWPKAAQHVYEPDPGSFALLEENVPRGVELYRAAVGRKLGRGRMFSHDGHPAGYRVKTGWTLDDGDVLIVPPSELVPACFTPFILKVDIEGAEDGLFDEPWADLFACVMIELHDYFFPGHHISRSFFQMLCRGNWDLLMRGDVLHAFNNDVLEYPAGLPIQNRHGEADR